MGLVQLEGKQDTFEVACTASLATTGVIEKRGAPYGCVFNETETDVTVTYHAGRTASSDRTLYADSDGGFVEQTIPAGSSREFPTELAGVPYVYPVSSVEITLHFVLTRR